MVWSYVAADFCLILLYIRIIPITENSTDESTADADGVAGGKHSHVYASNESPSPVRGTHYGLLVFLFLCNHLVCVRMPILYIQVGSMPEQYKVCYSHV